VVEPLKIEVVGNAKTGTTGVFNSIRVPLRERDPGTLVLFEPRSSSLYRLGRQPVPFSVLAKAMANTNGLKIAHHAFTHHVLITRDPRDTLVSHLLYLPLQPKGVSAGKTNLERFVALLQAKEADPSSCSFRELYERGVSLLDRKDWTWDKYLGRFRTMVELREQYEFFVLRYEEFVDNRLDALSEYLTLSVQSVKPKRLDTLNAHVVRSATYGDWRAWFTRTDVDFFRSRLADYMRTFAYDDDWSLDETPDIAPETASGYALSRRPVVEEKQQQRFQRSPGWTPRAVKSSADADAIRAVADDSGAGPHGYRYAMLLLEGRVTDRDPALAFQYAYRSALVGNLPGMELLAQMFREGIGTSVDAERAASWEHEAAVLRAPPPGPGQPARSVRPPRGVVPAARWWARRLRRAAGQRRRLGWSRR
jgi:hypothetical protein